MIGRIWRYTTSRAAQVEGSQWLRWLLIVTLGPPLLYVVTREEVGVVWIVLLISYYLWFFVADRKRWNWVQWVILLVIVVAIGSSVSIQYWDVLHDERDSVSTTVRNLGLIIGGVIAVLLAIWRSKVAETQADTAQQSLLNERYQQGAEMLGNNVLSVRLGGIYALERLVTEHPEQYHVQVMKLFCAFARNPTEETSTDSVPDGRGESRDSRLREDVQAVIAAIGGRSRTGLALEKSANLKLDLHGAHLSHARLSGVNLAGVNLSRADLRNAVFFEFHSQPPDLSEPLPSGPDQPPAFTSTGEFISPDLSGVEERRANLSLANLEGANLSGAYLLGTDLSGALLVNAKLVDCQIIYGSLRKTVLLGADLSRAFIIDSDLSGAKLAHANLSETQLPSVKLYGANLFLTELRGANLSGTVFSDTDEGVIATGLTQAQIDLAKASPNNPPSLTGVVDYSNGKPLVWRGKPCED